jgi:hypothetical protein
MDGGFVLLQKAYGGRSGIIMKIIIYRIDSLSLEMA